jgi:tRNA G37 N-methylase Trm5
MHNHGGFDYERMDEMRSKSIDVERIVDFAELKADDVICDMGSGSGFYSLLFARKCKHVYAFEWNTKGNEILERKMRENGVKNITINRENICRTSSFPECTKVFFSNSFHDFDCREDLVEIFRNETRPDFILIEFRKDAKMGPPVEIRISEEKLEEIFSRHGYAMKKRIEFETNYVSYFTPS